MITVLHGENVAQSRNAFIQLKQAQDAPLSFFGATVGLSDLMQAFEGNGLFAENQPVFIEELVSKKKQTNELKALLHYISSHETHTIVLWESKELSKKDLLQLKNAHVQKFDFSKTLFRFLDNLSPGTGISAMQLFHETLKAEEAEFVFFMVVRQIRLLLALTEGNMSEPIDEVKRLAPWQLTKLQKQAKAFGKDYLLDLYNKLFSIEKGLKTGTLTMPLTHAIDFLLIGL